MAITSKELHESKKNIGVVVATKSRTGSKHSHIAIVYRSDKPGPRLACQTK